MATGEFCGQACGIYPRVSTKKQAERDRSSLEDQEMACRDYAAECGMIVDEECVETDAYTSRKRNRPGLNELLATMRAHRVPHLIIDRVDRMTRGGQLAAADFLRDFIRAGITLHVVSMSDADDDDEDALVIRDDKSYKDFLDAAYAAQQDNKKRVRIVKRAKRARARDGHYIRGKHAPYGYRYEACEWDRNGNVTDKRMVPDERTFLSLGFPTTFASTPYAARQEMVRLYANGVSWRQIADRMTRESVPTSNRLFGRADANPVWYYQTVRYLVTNPLNEGILTNFRHNYENADPDDKHDEDWTRTRPVPREQQIIVEPKHGAPAPLVDAGTLARVAARREGVSWQNVPYRSTVYLGRTLLAGGMAVCGMRRLDTGEVCGGTLRVHSAKRRDKVYLYYGCARHDNAPSTCPGLSLSVPLVDPGAWFAVETALCTLDEDNDNYLDKLAAQQADLDSSITPGTRIEDLRAIRDAFRNEVDTLVLELGRTQSQIARDAIQRRMNQLEPEIAEAERQMANHARQASRVAERRELLADTLEQYHRYTDVVFRLDPYIPEHIPTMAAVMRAVGAKLTIGKTERGDPDISAKLTITPAAAAPWFSPETEVLLLGQAPRPVTYQRLCEVFGWQPRDVVSSEQEAATPTETSADSSPAEDYHRLFGTAGSSSRSRRRRTRPPT